MKKYLVKTEKETQSLAAKIASKFKGGEIIALEGELGAGKTTFTKGLAKSLGIKKHITSPTFVLMKIHPVQNSNFRVQALVHVDCYRLDEPQELFYLGIEEYLNQPETVVVIEWADKIKNYLKKFKKLTRIQIKITNKQREIKITY